MCRTITPSLSAGTLFAASSLLLWIALHAAFAGGGMQFEEGAGSVSCLTGTSIVVGGTAADSSGKTASRAPAKTKRKTLGPQPTLSVPFDKPAVPDFGHVPAGQFSATHDPYARRYIEAGGNGALVTCSVPVPEPTNTNRDLSACIWVKIYDVVGNLVSSSDKSEIVTLAAKSNSSSRAEHQRREVDVYWNGSNSKGMAVAPGVYKAFVYVDYSSPFLEDRLLTRNLRVGR